jgi:adenylyltransferase/sulfurtransferase
LPFLLCLLFFIDRQIIHDEKNQGMNKAVSAVNRLKILNSSLEFKAISEKILPSNVLTILSSFDIVVDATDNFSARYILNDGCVILKKILISGSAVSMEGQITVIIPSITPCYRCLYPSPSMFENCRSCANAGILGPVAGLIGCLEAIETIKVILNNPFEKKQEKEEAKSRLESVAGKQLFYDASYGDFHTFDLPQRNLACPVCSENPSIKTSEDIEAFINSINQQSQKAAEEYIGEEELDRKYQISCSDYHSLFEKKEVPHHLVIDVRTSHQFSLTSLTLSGLEKSVPLNQLLAEDTSFGDEVKGYLFNIPLAELQRKNDNIDKGEPADNPSISQLRQVVERMKKQQNLSSVPVYLLCRRGVDSVVASRLLLSHGFESVCNIKGGLVSWKETIDSNLPMY